MGANLPDQLIFEILLRLRLKPLCRFRRVSSSWRSIIDDPFFRGAHRLQAQRNPLLFTLSASQVDACTLDKQESSINTFDLWTLTNYLKAYYPERNLLKACEVQWNLAETCLELVCLYNSRNICIFNPTTRKLHVIRPHFSNRGEAFYDVYIAFVPSTKEYKVIQRLRWKGSCSVLTLGQGMEQWRGMPNPPYTFRYCHVAVVEGGMYVTSVSDHENVMYLDLEKEAWSVRPPIPDDNVTKNIYKSSLVELKGRLCRMKLDGDNVVHVWKLKDYEENVWTKEYRIVMPESITDCVMVDIEEDGRILMCTENFCKNKLEYFDADGTMKGEIQVPFKRFVTTRYVESFLSLGI